MEQVGYPGGAELLVIFFILMGGILGAILTIVPFWKICSKAGFPGALSLLLLIPVVSVILPFYIAFAKWPALSEKQNI